MKKQYMVFILLGFFLLTTCDLLVDPIPVSQQDLNDKLYGSESNPTGDPVGGGLCYSKAVTEGDYTVETADQLKYVLKFASPGDVVFVDPEAEIDMTGEADVFIPPGVTLASARGSCDSPGGLIFTDQLSDTWLFKAGDRVRVVGLRFRGPDPDFQNIDYDVRPRSWATCMAIWGKNVEVDNCEISNFHRGGVEVHTGGTDAHIHHNFFHDVATYPIFTGHRSSYPVLIEANLIHWVWTAIAGSGYPGTGYEARYNTIIRKPAPAAWVDYYGGNAVDMHSYLEVEESRGHFIAGEILKVHHNTFISEAKNDGSVARSGDGIVNGVPRVLAEFYNNLFLNEIPEKAIKNNQKYAGNTWEYNNKYGPNQQLVDISINSTPQILFRQPPPPDIEIPLLSRKELAVDVEIDVLEGLEISSVRIELNGQEIFSDSGAPNPGELVIDLCKLDPVLPFQELTVIATDDRGVRAQQVTAFQSQVCD